MEYLLGAEPSGKSVFLNDEDLKSAVLLNGKEEDMVMGGIILECISKGRKVVALDISNSLTRSISGYLKTVDSVSLIPDVLKIHKERNEAHALCFSSLLSNVLMLPVNQRLILFSAVIQIAKENGYITPSSIFDSIDLVDGFRATEKEEVEGKVASFGQIEIFSGELSLEDIVEKPCIISIQSFKNLHVSSFIASLILSKLAVICHESKETLVAVSGLGRLLKQDMERDTFFERYFLSGENLKLFSGVRGIGDCLSVEEYYGESYFEGLYCLVRRKALVKGPFFVFIPREKISAPEILVVNESDDGRIEYEILKAISESTSATKESVASWLSAYYPKEKVFSELDRIISERLAVLTKEEEKGRILTLKLTELGKQVMKDLEKNE
jgi:hypothetical protein